MLRLVPLLLVAVGAGLAVAKSPRPTELGVDQVILKSGHRLAGAVIHKSDDGTVTVAVAREWLQGRGAGLYEQQLREETARTSSALKVLLDRIGKWRTLREHDEKLLQFLDREAQRIESARQELSEGRFAASPRFMLVEVPRARLESVYIQPPDRKQVALVAWSEKLLDVERRTVKDLRAELSSKGIDVAKRVPDLSAELPVRVDDESQWLARQAIVEFWLRKSLAFQGTADKLYRTDDPAKAPDVTRLFGELLKSQVETQLAELLGDGAPKPARDASAAIREAGMLADKEQATGFRVTRLSLPPGNRSVTVEGSFFARMADGSWKPVWQTLETLDATKARPEIEQRLSENEQVQQVLKIARAAGAGEVEQALRAGAATLSAQETVDARFHEFFDRYTRRLEGPPFWLP